MNDRKYKIIAVDFDGTLCTHKYPFIGEPNHKMIRDLIFLKKNGHKLILWTCRRDGPLDEAVNWCKKLGLEFDEVNNNLPEIIEEMGGDSRKVFADIYLDDKGRQDLYWG